MNPSPVPAQAPREYLELANLALQISVGILTVLTVVLAVLAFVGIREIGIIRRSHRDVEVALQGTEGIRQALELRLQSFEHDMETLVLTAHLFNEGQNAYAAVDYDRAISFYEEALALQPENSRIKVRLARALVNKGLNSRAERLLRTITEAEPVNAEAWLALSTCYRFADHEKAIRSVEQAIDLDGKSADSWNYLGLLLRDVERYEESLSAHQEAAKLAPTEPLAPFYEALLRKRLGQEQESGFKIYEAFAKVEALKKASRIKPIWALTIEWVHRRHLDTSEQEARAVEIAGELARNCHESRNAEAVLSHILFYLASIGGDIVSDSSLRHFPAALVHKVGRRIEPRQVEV